MYQFIEELIDQLNADVDQKDRKIVFLEDEGRIMFKKNKDVQEKLNQMRETNIGLTSKVEALEKVK